MADDRFGHDVYVVRRKAARLLGAGFHITGPAGELLFYVEARAFAIKQDIRFYTEHDMLNEVLAIRGRHVIDLYAAYEIIESETRAVIGGLRRRHMVSLFREAWLTLDANGRQTGIIQECGTAAAIARRLAVDVVPQTFAVYMAGRQVCTFRQHARLFAPQMTVDFSADTERRFDRRIGLAAAVLLCYVEGRQ